MQSELASTHTQLDSVLLNPVPVLPALYGFAGAVGCGWCRVMLCEPARVTFSAPLGCTNKLVKV